MAYRCLLSLVVVWTVLLASCVQQRVAAPVAVAPVAVAPAVQEQEPPAPVEGRTSPGPAPEGAALAGEDGGCRAEAATPEVVTMRMVRLPDPGFVAGRVAFFRQEAARWQSEEAAGGGPCGRLAAAALAAYQELAAIGGAYAAEEELVAEPWEAAAADIAYLEQGCVPPDLEPAALPEPDSSFTGDAAMADSSVVAFHDLERWQESVDAYDGMLQVFPDWQPTAAARRAYADSLVRLGRAREGAAVWEELAAEAGDPVERYLLEQRVADLLLAAGAREAAAERYGRLVGQLAPLRSVGEWAEAHRAALLQDSKAGDPALNVYQLVLWEYFLADGRRVSRKMELALEQLQTFFPASPLRSYAERLVEKVRRAVYDHAQERLAALARAVDGRDFAAMNRIGRQVAALSLTDEQRARLESLLAAGRRMEEEELRRRAAAEEEQLAAAWQQAESLFAEQRWDAAIAAYTALAGSAYGDRARGRIVEAADRAAGLLRRRAAALFLRARKKQDAGQKRDLLERALQLLDTASRRYPQTSLQAKIAANRTVIERELARLPAPPAGGGAAPAPLPPADMGEGGRNR